MSGWNSLDSIGTLHALQISGLMVAAIVIACGMTTYHFLESLARSRRDR